MANPQSPALEIPVVKPVKDIGDFFVLKWYTLYFCFTCEVMMISQISNIIFMIFGGAVPTLQGCNNETLENVTSNDDVCEYFEYEFENDNCTPIETHDFKSINVEFQMYCKKASLIKLCTSIQMAGLMLGNIIFGQVSDLIGRQKTLYIGNAGVAVTCLLSSFSIGVITFTSSRFFVMMFTACTYSVTNVFMAESLPPKHRLWLMTVITYSPNYAFVSLNAYLTKDWRWMSRVTGIVALIPLFLLIFTYESPRWLIRKRKYDVCEKAIIAIGKWDSTNSPQKICAIERVLNNEREKHLVSLMTKKKLKKYNILHLFTHRSTTLYVLFFSYSFCMTSFVYYGIMFNMEKLSGSPYVNTILVGGIRYCINIICAVLDVQFLVIGRLPLHGFSMGFMTLGSFVLFGSTAAGGTAKAMSTFTALFVASFCSEIFILDNVQTSELLPTPVRNLGAGFVQVWNSIGHVIAPPLFQLGKLWAALPYLFMSVLCLTEFLLLLFFIPETKGRRMPEETKTPDQDDDELAEDLGSVPAQATPIEPMKATEAAEKAAMEQKQEQNANKEESKATQLSQPVVVQSPARAVGTQAESVQKSDKTQESETHP